MLKKNFFLKILITGALFTNTINAKTLSEENAEQIVLIKKAIVKLIKERKQLQMQCSVRKNNSKQLNRELQKEQQKLALLSKKQRVKPVVTKPIKKGKTTDINTVQVKKYKTRVFKRIYSKPDFGSKRLSSIKKGEIFTTKDDITKSWIFINDLGYIHINNKKRKGEK